MVFVVLFDLLAIFGGGGGAGGTDDVVGVASGQMNVVTTFTTNRFDVGNGWRLLSGQKYNFEVLLLLLLL